MRLKSGGVDLAQVKAVIFDVDGTLYDQSPLRLKMLRALLWYYLWRPWRYRELIILQRFRSEREKRPGASGDLETAQYRWVAEAMRCTEAEVRKVVAYWIYDRPNRYLKEYVYPGTATFIEALRNRGIKVAIYSDHKAHDKLKAMGLEADLVVCSTDPEVDRFKPDPAGLHHVARQLGLNEAECLFIGDRQELDGECAERAGMPYLIIEKQPSGSFGFYAELEKELERISQEHDATRVHVD